LPLLHLRRRRRKEKEICWLFIYFLDRGSKTVILSTRLFLVF
jgi:hypothetical protein